MCGGGWGQGDECGDSCDGARERLANTHDMKIPQIELMDMGENTHLKVRL